MPMRPKKPCSHPGCPNLTDGKYCEKHKAIHHEDRAGSVERGYGKRWQKARAGYLEKHPLCAECLKKGDTLRQRLSITSNRTVVILFYSGTKATGKVCVRNATTRRHGAGMPIRSTDIRLHDTRVK